MGSNRTNGNLRAARSGAPSVDPLSASTTSTGRVVAAVSVARKSSSDSPGEYVTATTRSAGAGVPWVIPRPYVRLDPVPGTHLPPRRAEPRYAGTLGHRGIRRSRPHRRGFGLLRTDRRGARGQPTGEACARPRPARPHRWQRLLRARAGDRYRGARVRRPPVPHLE